MSDQTLEILVGRLQELSAGLNARRVLPQPSPSSRIPLLGPLLNWVYRLANRLATHWYVAPQTEQQEAFNEESTRAFDEVASWLVFYHQEITALKERWNHLEAQILSTEAAKSSATADLFLSLPDESLRAWEEAGLPAQRPDRSSSRARPFDEAGVLHFPLTWTAQGTGWRYLFSLAVAGLALNCRPGDLVLDFAGGSGWVTEFLSRFGFRVVLLDYSDEQLRFSRSRLKADSRVGMYGRIDLVAGDGMQLPFADATFDGIICMNSLHHMASYEAALREMARVLKPGKRAVFAEPGERHAETVEAHLSRTEYGDLEKNVPLPLIYVYARRAGFARMFRYPYVYPEAMEFPYPGGGENPSAILQRLAVVLPQWMQVLSLFALEKEGEILPDSDLPPLWETRYTLRAEITLLEFRECVKAGEEFVERVHIKNTGDVIWLSNPRPLGGYVRLGVKLCDSEGRLIRDDLARVSLSGDMLPGDEKEFEVRMRAPLEPGQYMLKYDMVDEWRAWFESRGNRVATHALSVLSGETLGGNHQSNVK